MCLLAQGRVAAARRGVFVVVSVRVVRWFNLVYVVRVWSWILGRISCLVCVCICVCVYQYVGWADIAFPGRVGVGVFCEDACVYGCVCVLWCSVRVYVRKGGYVVIDSACGGVCEWACC